MKAYYSHPKSYKGSKEEGEDIDLLESLGYDVENPYDIKFSEFWQTEGIGFGRTLVEMCDVMAFRGLKNGKIGAGVGKELGFALEAGKKIIELPEGIEIDETDINGRILSIDETVEYFNTVGK